MSGTSPVPVVIDLSHWNSVTDFQAVYDSGIVGVMHKHSQGSFSLDPAFAIRKIAAKSAGLLWGRYHFGDASDVRTQVARFLAGRTEDEALALDFEDNGSNSMSLDQAVQFLQMVEGQTYLTPMLYSSNRIKECLKGHADPRLAPYRLWLAEYGPQAKLPPGWSSYWLWQYTSTGQVPGMSGNVDLDTFEGDPADLIANWTHQ